MDKIAKTLDEWCSGEGIDFVNPEAEAAYKRRAKRIVDVIRLKQPDRVPVVPSFGFYPALSNGYTCEEVMFDYDKASDAWLKTLRELQPDMCRPSGYAMPGAVLEALDYKMLRIPGRGIPADHSFQFVEKEYVKADEFYDAYLRDPSDFMMRTFLPRVCGALEPLKTLPPFSNLFGYYLGLIGGTAMYSSPEVVSAFDALAKAGKAAVQWLAHVGQEGRQMATEGYPDFLGGHAAAPFDVVGDWFRGTHGVMLDMFRHPDKLKAVMEALVPTMVQMGVGLSRRMGKPVTMLMLHKGGDSFLSLDQFKEFYWPTLRAVLVGLIDEGIVPMPLFEGDFTSRLELLKDIPEKSAVYWFEKVDIRKAKEILGDTVCFRGNVPGTILYTGTPDQVEAYVKELIDVVGKGGGLIVDSDIWFDEAKPENVKAMVDFTKRYGVYK